MPAFTPLQLSLLPDDLGQLFIDHLTEFIHGDIAHTNRTALDAVLGVNTGDQDLSGKENVGVAASLDADHLSAFAHGDIAHTNRTALDAVLGVNTGDQALSGTVTELTNVVTIQADRVGYRKYDVWLTDAAAPNSAETLIPPDSVSASAFSVVSDANGLYTFDISGTVTGSWYVHVSFGTDIVSVGPVTII